MPPRACLPHAARCVLSLSLGGRAHEVRSVSSSPAVRWRRVAARGQRLSGPAHHHIAPPAESVVSPPASLLGSSSVESRGAAPPYVCYTSVRTQEGPYRYRYSRLELRFPKKVLAPDGATLLYRVLVEGASVDAPRMVASCIIPRTREAVEITSQRLGVSKGAKRSEQRGDPKSGGGITTQGCVSDGLCELTAVQVTASECPDGWSTGEDGDCHSSRGTVTSGGGSTGGDWGSDGGGGDDPNPPAADTSGKDSSVCPQCNERDPSDKEVSDMKRLVNDRLTCPDVQEFYGTKLDSGNVAVFQAPEIGIWGEWKSNYNGGTVFISSAHWKSDGTVNEGELADTMAHEGAHAVLGHTDSTPSSEIHGDAWLAKMASCGFPNPS